MSYSDVIPDLLKDMQFVPVGTFFMGCRQDECQPVPNYPLEADLDALFWSKPQRPVYLDAYLMDRYPVTNARYKLFIDATNYPVPCIEAHSFSGL